MDFDILQAICIVLACLVAIVAHELAHGFVSYKLGDPTPKETGRLTLNPIRHLDPIGTLCLAFFHFGWAKPVMINPGYYKKPRLGMALVALAGPLTNFILAFFGIFLLALTTFIVVNTDFLSSNWFLFFYTFFDCLFIINIGLGVFNLIPIPPLDGSKIVGSFLREDTYYQIMRYEREIGLVLLIIIFLGVLDVPLSFIIGNIRDFYISIVSLIF